MECIIMLGKKIVSSGSSLSVPAPVVHTIGQSTMVVSPVVSSNARHLEEAKAEFCKEESAKVINRFLHGELFATATFTDLEWYEDIAKEIAILRLERAEQRKKALGLLACPVPAYWQEVASSKDKLKSTVAAWLCSLCREYKQDDAYQVDLDDLIDSMPAYSSKGAILGRDEKSKLMHGLFGSLSRALFPVVDRYTGEIIKEGFPACKLNLERVSKCDTWIISFTK